MGDTRVFYCAKCKADSQTPICERCGAPIPQSGKNERFRWLAYRLPLADGPAVRHALFVLLCVMLSVLLLLFLGELILSPDKRTALRLFTSGGLVPWAMILYGAGAALALLVLAMQGREEMHFVVDVRGAHLQTWIVPGRVRCYARFLPYQTFNIAADPQGNARMRLYETHLLWEDVCRFEVRRRACRIDLYRPAGFRFMSLYPAREELDALVEYVTPRMKHLIRK